MRCLQQHFPLNPVLQDSCPSHIPILCDIPQQSHILLCAGWRLCRKRQLIFIIDLSSLLADGDFTTFIFHKLCLKQMQLTTQVLQSRMLGKGLQARKSVSSLLQD